MKKILMLGALLAGLVSSFTLKADDVADVKAEVELENKLLQEQKFEELLLRIPGNYKATDADGMVMNANDAVMAYKTLIAARDHKNVDFDVVLYSLRSVAKQELKVSELTAEQEKLVEAQAKAAYQNPDAVKQINDRVQIALLPIAMKNAKLVMETLRIIDVKVDGKQATVIAEYERFVDPLTTETKRQEISTSKWMKILDQWMCYENISQKK